MGLSGKSIDEQLQIVYFVFRTFIGIFVLKNYNYILFQCK